jgi:hypothetical protein
LHAWRKGLKRPGTGLLFGIEPGTCGNVHLHFVYFGGFIKHEWLVTTCSQAYGRAGFVSLNSVGDEPADMNRAVREAVKYTVKAASPLSEKWFAIEREVMHPELAARWEIATHALHLRGRLGEFRRRDGDVDHAEDAEERGEELAAPEPLKCSHCGRCAAEVERDVDTREWVKWCHARGERAFRGSRGDPPRVPSAESQHLIESGWVPLDDAGVAWVAVRDALNKPAPGSASTEVFFV